jgi:O-antigen ligase
VLVGLGGAALVLTLMSAAKVGAVLLGLIAAAVIAVNLELGLFALVFVCYSHLSQVLIDHHGAPSILDPLVVLVAGLTALQITMRRIPLGPVLRAAVPIIAYGLAGLATLLVAVNREATLESLRGLVSDAVVALLIVALLRTRTALRGTVWALLSAGLLLGSLTVHQEFTKNYEDTYWGFSIAKVKDIAGAQQDYRIGGPVKDPNFYGLFLVPLVPLALDRFSDERRKPLRLLALVAFAVVFLSVVFTYSRGGFLSMVATVALTLVRRPPPLKVLLFVLLAAVPLLSLVPSQYSTRMTTILSLRDADEGHGIQDSGMRGRLSEMTVAMLMFVEDPLLGVGLANFPHLYQEYARRIAPDSRLEIREPHSRYLEVAAEMGLVGILAFSALLASLFLAMRAGERGLKAAGDLDGAGMVRSVEVGLIGFLIGSIFLHSAFSRFFWVLAGIALATRNTGSAATAGSTPQRHAAATANRGSGAPPPPASPRNEAGHRASGS